MHGRIYHAYMHVYLCMGAYIMYTCMYTYAWAYISCISMEGLACIGSTSSVVTGCVLIRLVCAIALECYWYNSW